MKANIGKYLKTKSQKISVEIERHDTYSFDRTLAHIILPALIQLKETQHGIPSEFSSDPHLSDQTCFDFYVEDTNIDFDSGEARWKETLDKMIWSFQQLVCDDYDSKYHHGKMKWDWEKVDGTIHNPITGKTEPFAYKLVDLNPGEHWYDSVGHQLHEERIQEGLELFGKYYRSLWD